MAKERKALEHVFGLLVHQSSCAELPKDETVREKEKEESLPVAQELQQRCTTQCVDAVLDSCIG